MSAIRLCSLSQRTPRYFARHGALFVRSVHRRSTLPYPIEKGLGKFLPPPALKVVAVDYQDGLLERLNAEARGALCCAFIARLTSPQAPNTKT